MELTPLHNNSQHCQETYHNLTETNSTKLCIIVDSQTPVLTRVPFAPGTITLRQFKAVTSFDAADYKFYFRNEDPEFGVVKEEIVEDDICLPVDGDKIVAWVISQTTNNLPRPITPDSIYLPNEQESFSTSHDLRQHYNSISHYEATLPASPAPLVDLTLHCTKDDIRTVYMALLNDTKSLDIKDGHWLGITIKDTFQGSALTKWLKKNVNGFKSQREINNYANQMLDKGLIHSPLGALSFSNMRYYTLSSDFKFENNEVDSRFCLVM